MLSSVALTFLDIRFKWLGPESVAKHPRIQSIVDMIDMKMHVERCAQLVPTIRFVAEEFLRRREYFAIAEPVGLDLPIVTRLNHSAAGHIIREEWKR